MEELKKELIKILSSDNLQKRLMNLDKKTLQQYVVFVQNHN
jgi:hypothetical protein